jgi:hypothetical protein
MEERLWRAGDSRGRWGKMDRGRNRTKEGDHYLQNVTEV